MRQVSYTVPQPPDPATAQSAKVTRSAALGIARPPCVARHLSASRRRVNPDAAAVVLLSHRLTAGRPLAGRQAGSLSRVRRLGSRPAVIGRTSIAAAGTSRTARRRRYSSRRREQANMMALLDA